MIINLLKVIFIIIINFIIINFIIVVVVAAAAVSIKIIEPTPSVSPKKIICSIAIFLNFIWS